MRVVLFQLTLSIFFSHVKNIFTVTYMNRLCSRGPHVVSSLVDDPYYKK